MTSISSDPTSGSSAESTSELATSLDLSLQPAGADMPAAGTPERLIYQHLLGSAGQRRGTSASADSQ